MASLCLVDTPGGRRYHPPNMVSTLGVRVLTKGAPAVARRTRRPLGPLDLRAQAILRAVIEEYVTTATPVGSQALVEQYDLRASSATARSVLAALDAA